MTAQEKRKLQELKKNNRMTEQEVRELEELELIGWTLDNLYDTARQQYGLYKMLHKDISDKHYHIYKELQQETESVIDDLRKMADEINDLVWREKENDKKRAEEIRQLEEEENN